MPLAFFLWSHSTQLGFLFPSHLHLTSSYVKKSACAKSTHRGCTWATGKSRLWRACRLAEIRRRQQEMLGGQVRDRPAALVPVRRGQVMITAPPPNYYNPLPNAAAIGGGTPAYQPGNRAGPAFERRAGSAVATAIATPGRPARNPDFTHRSPASPGNGAGGMMHEPPAARRGLSLTPVGNRRSNRHLNPIAYLPVDDWRK